MRGTKGINEERKKSDRERKRAGRGKVKIKKVGKGRTIDNQREEKT